MSNPYRPSRELASMEPLCGALVAAGATEAQACEALARALIELRWQYQRYVETNVAPVMVYVLAERGE